VLIKRAIDIFIAIAALLLFSPLLLLIALFVRLRMGSPILFRQLRPGLNERPFHMIKFRTMRDTRDGGGHLLSDAERLTSLGRFLRNTSLDEFPELWNVLKGEMSLVGPRPLLPEYLAHYNEFQRRRHEVKPGITGWAQINGRNSLSWNDKFKLDVWYVDNASFLLDMRILWRTLLVTFRRNGIAQSGHVTMPKFAGNMSEVNT
jgi:sugar transferase EpsL